MQFYSTKNKKHLVSLKQAVFKGLPPDNGLYMPENIPVLSDIFFRQLPQLSLQEIAFRVSQAFFGEDLDDTTLQEICEDAINFDAPVVSVHDNIFTLELFHGPTLAFKDFGARFMSRLLSRLHTRQEKTIHILVATSGDTGSAVAQGFYDVPGIEVLILYPSGKVSPLQEKQIATLDKNITALEVQGTFDDCQRLVKQAFLDEELNKEMLLSSANSINIARLLPQSFYYFSGFGQMKKRADKDIVICVPSGNFGNLTAGLIAKYMGLPVKHYIAALNANDVFLKYLNSGTFEAQSSVRTISNAMDVGDPSNLGRIMDLYDNDITAIRTDISSFSYNDDQTRGAIKTVSTRHGYTLDPHGAVGYLALQDYLYQNRDLNANGLFFETAHPAKFRDVVEPLVSKEIELPETLKSNLEKEKHSVVMASDYRVFKHFLYSYGK